ncbi:MAG: hypothetical protein ABIG96_01015 [Candidatus Micrarchaeota archaeon]
MGRKFNFFRYANRTAETMTEENFRDSESFEFAQWFMGKLASNPPSSFKRERRTNTDFRKLIYFAKVFLIERQPRSMQEFIDSFDHSRDPFRHLLWEKGDLRSSMRNRIYGFARKMQGKEKAAQLKAEPLRVNWKRAKVRPDMLPEELISLYHRNVGVFKNRPSGSLEAKRSIAMRIGSTIVRNGMAAMMKGHRYSTVKLRKFWKGLAYIEYRRFLIGEPSDKNRQQVKYFQPWEELVYGRLAAEYGEGSVRLYEKEAAKMRFQFSLGVKKAQAMYQPFNRMWNREVPMKRLFPGVSLKKLGDMFGHVHPEATDFRTGVNYWDHNWPFMLDYQHFGITPPRIAGKWGKVKRWRELAGKK